MLERYKEFKTLLVEQEGRLLSVTLNRPESLNAVGGGMHEELEDLWALLRADHSVGAVLLSGAGRAFCAGGDVKGMAATASSGDKSVGRTAATLLYGAKRLVMGMLEVEQPVVAAVHGYAMGLGATIALCSDIVIAADDAVLADTHVAIGLVAGDGGTVMWPMLLPINTAKYYLLTGDRLTGKDAERLGLVVRALPADQVLAEAKGIARRLADGPTLAVQFTKVAVNKILRDRANLVFDTSLALEAVTLHSEDHREAGAAFVEKRNPEFHGR